MTLEGIEEPASRESVRGAQPWRLPFFLGVLVVVVVVTALATYNLAPTKTNTRVIVRSAPVTTVAPRNCVPGAAPGSCNTDEFAELKIPDVPLSAATRALLARQLIEARTAAMKYPTVADARRAGMIQAGGFSPETGAHFLARGGGVGPFDAAHPGSYMYDGISPTSKVVGVMYLSQSAPVQNFAGPNDHWHRHSNTCFRTESGKIVTLFPVDSDVTESQCATVHGVFLRESTWMVHAWVVPGWESPLGVFAHNNPDLLCANGSSTGNAEGFCQGT